MNKENTIEGVNVFAKKDNKFLAVKRSKSDKIFGGMWALPGGKIEEGETHKDTGEREIKEETGLKLISLEEDFCLQGELHIVGYPTLLISIHRGVVSDEDPNPQDKDIDEVAWIDKDSFLTSLKENNYPPEEIEKLEKFFVAEGC